MNVMKHYFRIWINAVILCMLAVFASACKDDDDIILNSPPWPGYPDDTQEILRVIVENENGENLLNPDTEGHWLPGVSWMEGSFYMSDLKHEMRDLNWKEYKSGERLNRYDYTSIFIVRSLKLQTEPWQTWDVSTYSDKDYSLAICAFCKREVLQSLYSFKTKFSLYVPMREEPFVFEITGKYNDGTHIYSDLKILMDSEEQESQLIHLVIPSRPPQP